jgi:hypothetical protein
MHTPQIILLSLIFIELLLVSNQHGKPRGNYSIGSRLMDTALFLGLLYWGGFFN